MNRIYLPYQPNKFAFGDFMHNVENGAGLGKLGSSWGKMSSGMSGAINAGATMLGGVAGGAIGGGLQSGAGSVISGLGDVASAIPGPWGAIAGAGLKVIGGLTNRAFGSKLNQENINKVNSNISQLKNFNSNAGSFDELTSNMASMPAAMGFGNKFIGKDGWFSHKAKKKARDLRNQLATAQTWAEDSLLNNLENLQDEQYDNMMANYSAMGGPLFSNGMDWTNGLKIIDAGGTHEENPNEGVQMGVDGQGTPNLVEQGEVIWNDYVFSNRIQIPKELRQILKIHGKDDMTFAEAVKKLQKSSEERPNDPIEKRGLNATLARLAQAQESIREQQQAQEKQQQQAVMAALGGLLQYAHGGRLGNRFDGPGEDSQYLWNPNYPFLNYTPWDSGSLITPPLAPNKAAEMPEGSDHINYYNDLDFSKYNSSNGYAEPNHREDGYIPYVRNMTDEQIADLRSAPTYTAFTRYVNENWDSPYVQRYLKNLEQAAGGNHLFDISGNPVEGAKDYWNTARTSGQWGFYSLTPKGEALSDADIAFNTPWNPNSHVADSLGSSALNSPLPDQSPEGKKKKIKTKDPNDKSHDPLSYLRFVPALGAGLASFSDLIGWTNRPDYSSADMVLRSASGLRDVRSTPLGDYERYSPFDRMYYLNQLNANAGATRRAIVNNSGLNRGQAIAGLLTADNQYLNQIGSLGRQAEEYNLGQRHQVKTFNRGTNQFNSEQSLKAQIANNSNREVGIRATAQAAAQAAALRDAADARASAARSANLTNFFNSLGDIGREAFTMDMIRNNPWLLYDWNGNYKGGKSTTPSSRKVTVAKGGYITIKNKRRR